MTLVRLYGGPAEGQRVNLPAQWPTLYHVPYVTPYPNAERRTAVYHVMDEIGLYVGSED